MSLARSIQPAQARRWNWRWISFGIATVSILVLLGANAHLVYVALKSQPECVPHTKAPGDTADAFRAAKSAC